MKKYLFLTTVMTLALSLGSLTGCSTGSVNANPTTGGQVPGAVMPQATDSSQPSGIWVSGTGKVSVTPDVAIASLGVSDQETTVAAAENKTNSAMNSVLAALKQNGVADKDIQTTYYSIQQVTRYDSTKNQNVVTGYSVTNTVTAKIRTLDKAGSILDAVATAGGDLTRINDISLTVDNPQNYYGQARTAAVADAKAKADQLASLTGVKLGAVFYITESTGSTPVPVMVAAAVPAATGAPVPVSAGQTDITLYVTVAYAISQ